MRQIIYCIYKLGYDYTNRLVQGLCMKKTNKVQNNDVDFLELFKKSLALSFTVFLFGVQQSYANNNITPGGNYGTQIEGGTSNNTNITGGTINNGTGFHHFDQFQVGQGGTANLIFAEGADRYVNMVNNQVSIYGIFNALKGGNIGGDVIFVSPGGLIVGSSGIMNVGSLQTITPSLTDYNRVLGTTNLSDITSLLSNSTSSSTRIDGKIFAKDSINIADGRSVTINKNADIVAGFNENGFDKSRLQGFKMSDIVNESGIVDSAYMTEGAGNISIVANTVNTSGVSDGSAHIIQSSGDITIDTPKVGDIGVITSGSKIYANGDVNIGNDAAQSGTGTVLIEQDVTALGNVNIKAMANIAQEADVTAGKNISIKADIYNQTKDTVTTSTNSGTINIDGAAKLGRVINKNGNIEIKAATNSDLTFQNTVTAENGNINVSSTSGNIIQADDTFDALQTKNGGTLSIRTYGPSMSIGSESQALNLDVDGAVDISSVRGISHLKSNNSTLTLGNISGVSTLDAQSKKDISIKDNIEVGGEINLRAEEGINQQSGSITSTGSGNIDINNGASGAINVGNITNYDGDINIKNQAEGEKLTISQRLEATGDINISSNAGIEQTDSSYISSTANGNISMTNNNQGDLIAGNVNASNGAITIDNKAEEGSVFLKGNLQSDKGYVDISSQNNVIQTGSIVANGVNGTESVKITAANIADLNSITAKNGIQIDADSVKLNNLVQSTEGGINISANGDITQTISGKSLDAKGDINLITSENGDIGKLAGETAQGQSIGLNSGGKVTLAGGNINVSSPDKDVTFGSVQAKHDVSLSTTASSVPVPGGKITFNDSVSGEKISINSVKDIDINNNITSSGGMEITAKEGINQSAVSVLTNNTSGSVKLNNTDSGNINTTTITNNGGDIEVTNSATVSDDSGKVNLNGVYTTNSGKVSVSAQGDIIQNESIEKAIIAGGNVSLESIEGSIGTDTRFITMQTQSPISAKAAEGSVYLKTIGSDLKLTDDSEIVFGKDIGLASDKTVIIEKSDGITASDGSIYIDSNGLFNLDKNLTAKNYIEIKGANGINLQSNSTLTTTGTGEGVGNINIINAGASSGQGKGVVNINNINSTGKVSIKSDNVRTDSNKLTINSGATIQASKGIDIASGTGINQNAGSSIINTDSGNISITNTVGESNIGRVINQNGDITISSSTNNGNIKFNDEVNAQNGNITVKSNTYIIQNTADAILKAEGDINLTSNFDTGSVDSALKVNSGGKVNSTGRGIYLESPDMDINTGTITASRDVNIKTTGTSGSLNATGTIKGQNVVINTIDSIMQDESLDLAINATGNINLTAQNGNIGSSSGTGDIPNRLDVASGGIVTASASKGEININSVNKNITFGNIISAGDINLSSTGNAGQITTNSTLQADNGSINIDSSKNIILNNKVSALNDVNLKAQTGIKHTAGEMSSATGNVNITNAVSGDIILKNVTASDGNITISAENSTGDISLTGKLTALSSDTTNGVVTINSGRNLSQTGTDSGISAQNSIHLSSKTGSIGKSDTDNIKINIDNTDGLLTADAENGSIYVQTSDKDLNLGSISAKDNVSLKTTGASGNINIKDTITGGNLSLNSVENIKQDSSATSLISSGNIILNALGDVDSIKVSADGNVSGSANNFYVESLEKDLKTGVISSQGKIYLNASGTDASVILNGLAKANDVEIIADKNIQQDSTLEKAIEASTDVSLTALNGNIGEPKTETVAANAIDLSAGGRITASASQGSVIINGVESNIQTDNITAKNDIDLTTTTSGKITVTNDLITDTGYIRLDSAEDLVISNNIQAKGDVILEAQNGISQTDGNIASTGKGNVLVTNNERNDISLKKLTTADGNINITNNALNANVILNDVVTSGSQGTITIGSQGNIEQTFDSTALISSGDITLNAKGNVGKLEGEDVKFIKVSTDGNVGGSGQNFYVESPDKDLATGNITATDDVILKSTATDKSVILNGLIKGNEVSVIADKNIYQNEALEKSIEAVTDVILIAQHGDIGQAAGTSTEANAIDLTAGGTIAASAAEGSVIINGVKSNIVTDNITAKNNIDLTTTQSGKITVSNDLVTDTGYIRLNSAQDLEIANNITANGNVILVANDGIIQSDGLIQSSGSGKVLIQNYNAGDISIKDVLSKSGGIDIINSAVGGDVILNTTISTTNNGDIFIEANRDILQNFVGDAISAGADVRLVSVTGDIGKSNNYINLKVLPGNKVDASAMKGSVNLNSNAQDIHFGTIEAGQNINLSTTESGKIYLDNDLTTNGGSVKLDSAENLEIQKNITASGNIVLNANGGIVQTDGNVNSTGDGSIVVTNNSSGDISLKKLSSNNGNIEITNNASDNDVILNDEIRTENQANINITSQRNILQNGDNVVLNSDGQITLNAKKDIGLLDRFINIFTRGDGKVNAQAENIYIGSVDNDLNTGNISALNNANIKTTGSSGSVIAKDDITAGNEINITSVEDIVTNSSVAAKNVDYSAAGNITANNITAENNITLTGGEITTTGNISSTDILYDADSKIQTDGSVVGDNVTLISDGNIITNEITGTNDVTITAQNSIEAKDKITSTEGNVLLTTTNGNIITSDIDAAIGAVINSGSDITTNGKVNAQNIDFDSVGNIVTNGIINGDSITFDSQKEISTNNLVTGKVISLTTIGGNITTNNDITAENNITVSSGKGVSQKSGTSYTISDNGNMTVTSADGDLILAGSVINNNGNVDITNNSSGKNSLTVNNLNANGDFSIINNADGLLNLTGTINNVSQNSVITANNTGSGSGIVTTGTINNTGSVVITNKGQQGIQLGGNLNNNIVESDESNPSKITVNNTNGALNITAEILNGINKDSKNEVYLANSGSGGLNFTAEGLIDNHGVLNVENTSGNMSLWGTLKARLKSQNNFTNTGITGSADDDVIIGLKLENWGNEITYENTGAGSLVIHEDAVLSNFSVEDGDGVHTGILNLKNSGNDGTAGGGIEINGTINNGIISDGTIVGEDNQIIPEGQLVAGGIVNIENNGTGVKVDSETISSQRRDDFGIEINDTAKINNYSQMNIINNNENSIGKIQIEGTITGDKGVININNKANGAESGIVFSSSSKTDVKGNSLNIKNNGQSGIIFEKGTNTNSTSDITIENNNGDINIDGVLHADNISITSKDSDIKIAHNVKTGNVTAENNVKIDVTNGSVLNSAKDDVLSDATGISAGKDISIKADNIGKLDSTLNDIINQGFNLDPNNAVHISANGRVDLSADNALNIKSIDKDLNINSLSAKDAILSTNNGSINSLNSTTENLYLLAQGDNSKINLDNLTNTGKLWSESESDTTLNSLGELNIETMYSKNGSIKIESEGNTHIKEITAPQDITIKVNDEKLSIETLGRIKRNPDVAPSTVNLTVLDSKRKPSSVVPHPGMNPDELANVTPNSKLDIMHAYVKDKVTLKADTITAQAYDISDTSQKGDKRIDSDGNAATGFHNANTEGKLLEFDIQGANYAQGDVSDVSDNIYYQPDADDKKALNVHLTLGDSVGDALYGAEFKKLYADYAFIDSVNNSNPDAISHIVIDSGIIGEKAIIRNNHLRLDINNTDVVFDYPINKHYDDAPSKILTDKGSFNVDMYEKIDINKGPFNPNTLSDYNPNRIVKDPDLEEMTDTPEAKPDDNRITKSERSTGFREINWTVRNIDDEIIGSSDFVREPIVKNLVGVYEKGLLVEAEKSLTDGQTVHVSLAYKDVPFNVDGKVKRIPGKELAEIEFINIDRLTSAIMMFVSMYQENL